MSEQNVEMVKQMYAAFGRGDIPAILDHIAENVHWGYSVREVVPWHAPIKGKANLPDFFSAFGANTDVQAFEPKEFIHSGDHVVVALHIVFTVKRTGRKVDMDQIHWWTFDRQGKAVRMVHFEDSAQVLAAGQGSVP